MRVFVLGKNGMLGRYVYTYLKDKFNVIGTTRASVNALDMKNIVFNLDLQKGDVVINCIGLIKQREGYSNLDFIMVNSIFPLQLQEYCEEQQAKLIHVTTDCVFSGDSLFCTGSYSRYTEDSPHDATDIYGKTKSLGEPEDATVIRTSVIGEELTGKLSLLEWVKKNRNKEVRGYSDHFWNGITCLQFAKICEEIINGKGWIGVHHIYSPEIISKYTLIKEISYAFNLNNLQVHKHASGIPCDRSLYTKHTDRLYIPSIITQLRELKEFSKTLKEGDVW